MKFKLERRYKPEAGTIRFEYLLKFRKQEEFELTLSRASLPVI
jgi:hypothetical protein